MRNFSGGKQIFSSSNTAVDEVLKEYMRIDAEARVLRSTTAVEF